MISLNLSADEVRIVGCLMEKSVTTPDQYPLTLNALTNACNQKSARSPVMALTQGVVQHTTRGLSDNHLIRTEENFSRGIEKYSHRFCNTAYSELQFDEAQFAIVCMLLLRGAQTPGELRAHSGRLHEFADNTAVVEALSGLMIRDDAPLVVQLHRTPGRKDAEYRHLFSGPIDIDAYAEAVQAFKSSEPSGRVNVADLAQRLSDLEAEVADLKQQLGVSK
jgi:uncharacterized protein YceH (UPF0502 family)|tara:strand:+ start:34889 stop:35551 length:663 start_codon:yes stop_codon:yes gene_type:complete